MAFAVDQNAKVFNAFLCQHDAALLSAGRNTVLECGQGSAVFLAVVSGIASDLSMSNSIIGTMVSATPHGTTCHEEAQNRQNGLFTITVVPQAAIRDLNMFTVLVKIAPEFLESSGTSAFFRQLSFALDGAIVALGSTISVPCNGSTLSLQVEQCNPTLSGSSLYGRVVGGRTTIVARDRSGTQGAIDRVNASGCSPWKSSSSVPPPSALASPRTPGLLSPPVVKHVTTPTKFASPSAGASDGTSSPWKTGSPMVYKPSTPSITIPSAGQGRTADARVDMPNNTLIAITQTGADSNDHQMHSPQQSALLRELDASASTLLAGLSGPLQQLIDLVLLPLRMDAEAAQLRCLPAKGILLHGPPGVGKTLLVRSLAQLAARVASSKHASATPASSPDVAPPPFRVFSVAGAEVISPVPGEAERRLRDVFTAAKAFADCHPLRLGLIFLDELDALAPRRASIGGRVGAGTTSGAATRLVTQLLTLIDGTQTLAGRREGDGQVVVIGATNRPDAIDPALRRPGRFDREVAIAPPNADDRAAILTLHSSALALPLAVNVDSVYLYELARSAVGFVGADLQSLCFEAQQIALKRASTSTEHWEQAVANAGVGKDQGSLEIEQADFERARFRVGASALRGFSPTGVRPTAWDDIGGMRVVIQRLREAVEAPMRYAPVYRAMGLAVPRGVLLYGPPGNSKTTLVRALACAVQSSFVCLSTADVLSAYVGEAEATLRAAFARARRTVPAILFLDEIDAMVGKRRVGGAGSAGSSSSHDVTGGLLTTLLTEMDGVASADGVVVVAATNRPQALDPALLRPGRLELHIAVPSPDSRGRAEVLGVHTRAMPLHADVDLEEIAREEETGGWSGAELENLCREAAMAALREGMQHIPGELPTPSSLSAMYADLIVADRHFRAALCTLRCGKASDATVAAGVLGKTT